jgi:hypothetical protein
MSSTKNQNVGTNAVPQATVVSDSGNGGILVDEETLKQDKRTADDALARRKRDQQQKDDQELQVIQARYDEEIRALRKQLDSAEATEKRAMDAVEAASKAAKDIALSDKLSRIRAEEESEKRSHDARMREMMREEEEDYTAWLSRNGKGVVTIYEDRERILANHQKAKTALKLELERQKEEMIVLQKQTEAQWKQTCNESNEKHLKNLFVGIVLGGLAGFVIEKARM